MIQHDGLQHILGLDIEKTYVAEIKVPTFFYFQEETRKKIPNVGAFEILKGYWKLRSISVQSAAGEYAEFVVVISFHATSLKEAEEHALKVGRIFTALVSSYAGHPAEPPELIRIALVDAGQRLMMQTNYWYGEKIQMLSEFSQTAQYGLQSFIEAVSSMDVGSRYKIQSATYWYGIALDADDPTVSVVAAWTGLECIGTELDSNFHENGPKATCEICNNEAGKKRDRKIAGIQHMFCWLAQHFSSETTSEGTEQIVASDILEDFGVQDALALRNDIVHGLDDVSVLAQRSSEVRRHMFHVLNASIQNTVDTLPSTGISGHYEFHPAGRVSITFGQSIAKTPYFGEWFEGFQVNTSPTDSKPYVGTVEFEWPLPNDIVQLIDSKSEEIFQRDSDIFEVLDESVMTGLSTWHNRLAEPLWEKMES